MLPVTNNPHFTPLFVLQIRAIVTRRSGIPVGVFRLTHEGKEIFDCHQLDDYNIDVGATLRMETWDGWTEFLNVCITGYTSHVFKKLSQDEVVARYQMKVALFIAGKSFIKIGLKMD